MRTLYSFGIYLFGLFMWLFSFWNKKAKQRIRGERVTFSDLQKLQLNTKRVTWFHAASLGEFEQGRPLIEAYRKEFPDSFILLSFFSPSGYEVRRDFAVVDHVCYLPLDTKRNARKWVALVNPGEVFFIKYEFWYNYLWALSKTSAKVFQVSLILRPQQYFFRTYGSWFRKQLKTFTRFFVQNEETFDLLQSIGFYNVTLSGDTRFDRVFEIQQQTKSYPLISTFQNERPMLIVGSSWSPDEDLVAAFLQQQERNICCMIVPHDVNAERIASIRKKFPQAKLYSELEEGNEEIASVLIVDRLGMLSSLYPYASLAYVGGGFGKGIHNILEPATFGLPICFGPHYQKFKEARDLVELKGAFVVETSDDLSKVWQETIEQKSSSAAEICRNYVQRHIGATKIIFKHLYVVLAMVSLGFFSSCSVNRHIPEGTALLAKNKIKVEGKTLVKEDLWNLIKQDPNSSFLGMKIPLHIYALSPVKPDKECGWFSRNILRKIGEPPVICNPNLTKVTVEEMETYVQSKGCFQGVVKDSTYPRKQWFRLFGKKQRLVVDYHITPGGRYKIANVVSVADDPKIQEKLDHWMTQSLIHKGDFYDEDILKHERERIALHMKRGGYYAFSVESISFVVDTSQRNYLLDIKMQIRNPRVMAGEDSLSKNKHKQYRINDIYINQSYSTEGESEQIKDTNAIPAYNNRNRLANTYYFIQEKKPRIKTDVLSKAIRLDNDSLYDPLLIDRTYGELSSLQNFKYINIEMKTSANSQFGEDMALDYFISLQPIKSHSLTNSFETNYSANTIATIASSSSGSFGFEWKSGYQHRNLFRGAEIFSVGLKTAAEVQSDFSTNEEGPSFWSLVSAYELGLDVGVEIPRFLFPYGKYLFYQALRPHTTMKVGYNIQKRSYFDRNILNLGYGYIWRNRQTMQHSFFPVEINFVKMDITSEEFRRVIHQYDKRIQYQYTDHLVVDMRYGFVYSGKGTSKNYSYLRWGIEAAGNVLQAYSNLAHREKNAQKQHEIFSIPFAQYVHTSIDFRHYIQSSYSRNLLVLRVFGGIGIPYGNAMALPYEKSFASGGANNLRAWQLRQLGPGTSSASGKMKLDRTGDIILGCNAEYRFPLVGSFLESAVFVDAGNIWLLREAKDSPGGKFDPTTFYKELGVGVGLGFRFDFQFFVFRIDLALKAWDPASTKSAHWVLKDAKFKDIVVHFGIDYPF